MTKFSLTLVVCLAVMKISGIQGRPEQFDVDKEKFLIDAGSNREVILLSGGDLEGSLVVIEHNKGLISWSIPSMGECYLIGGVDQSLPDATQLQEQFKNGQFLETASEDVEGTFTYRKAHDHPVKDLSVLPPELLSPCSDKDVFWLEKVNAETEGDRQQRGYCFNVCYTRNGFRVCYRRCR